MCGIVGIVSAYGNGFSTPEAEAFQRMLFLDTFRGWDSTGVFGVDNHANVGILKEASMGPLFITKPEYQEWHRKLIQNGKFAVGHNRAATRGTIKDENAHPFWVNDNIVLVQNGTFFGDHKHLKDTEVDSEAIAHVLEEEDDVEKALNRVNSAYALVWFNVKQRSLNIIRNIHRPLYIAYTASGATLFASEAETINYAVVKAGWKMKTEPYLLKEDNLLKLTLEEKGGVSSENITIAQKKTFSPLGHVGGMVPRNVGFVHHHSHSRSVALVEEPSWQSRFPETSDAITKQFFDVFPGDSHEYDLGKEEVPLVNNLYIEATKTKRRFIVETQDYFPANKHEHCRIWHVVATLLTPEKGVQNKIAIHWLMANMPEADIYQYVTGLSWFEVELGGLIISKHGERYIARVKGTNATPVQETQTA